VTRKNAIFCDVTPCGSCKIRRFEQTYLLHHQVKTISELQTTLPVTTNRITMPSVLQFLVTANVPASTIPVTLMI
jgi:hypothetical protein